MLYTLNIHISSANALISAHVHFIHNHYIIFVTMIIAITYRKVHTFCACMHLMWNCMNIALLSGYISTVAVSWAFMTVSLNIYLTRN